MKFAIYSIDTGLLVGRASSAGEVRQVIIDHVTRQLTDSKNNPIFNQDSVRYMTNPENNEDRRNYLNGKVPYDVYLDEQGFDLRYEVFIEP